MKQDEGVADLTKLIHIFLNRILYIILSLMKHSRFAESKQDRDSYKH